MRALLAAVLASALLGGCVRAQSAQPPQDPFIAAFRSVRPAVVMLTMRVPAEHPTHRGELEDAFGSGVVVASGAWGSEILTDEHVIEDASNLQALVGNKRRIEVRVKARDVDDDLALLETATPDLPVARLGTVREIEAGAAIGIAGYPIPDAFEDEGLGTQISVYAGRISSLRKNALELDLPVIPGDSGGAVFDAASGEVIAIAESRFDDERAIGFGIPIQVVLPFLDKYGHARE